MQSRNFLNTISAFIAEHKLLDERMSYIVALSGGADSTALLLSLKALGYRIEAAHCNFHLRGEESDRDEAFCKALCEKEGIPFHLIHFDTHTYAELHKVSIEMAARELRYRYFEQLRKDIKAEAICVAHHRDDSVETVLLNLVRGTGYNGLTGISAKNEHIIRPFLCVSRKDITCFLKDVGQDYVDDSTNFIDDVQRNKIRLNIIPLLKQVNLAAVENIDHTSRRLEQASAILNSALDDMVSKVTRKKGDVLYINRELLAKQISSEYVLWQILSKYGFSSAMVEDMAKVILSASSGCEWQSATHIAATDRNDIIVAPLEKEEFKAIRIPETGNYVIDNSHKIRISCVSNDGNFKIERDKSVACLDADKVKFPLTLRRARKGDRFIPFGMKGSKLLSDYMTDRKFSIIDKRKQLIIEDNDGKIVWLVNERPDNRVAITPETKKIIKIEL